MGDYPGQVIQATQESAGNFKFNILKSKKFWIGVASFLLIIVITAISWFYLFPVKTEKQAPQTTEPIDKILESHPELFLADIEYNPQTGLVVQHGTSKTNGDPPLLLGEKPPSDPNRFVYKILVLSKDNISLQSGWYSIPLEIVQTQQNTLRFDAVIFYEREGILQIEIDDKLVWSVKME